MGCENWVVEVNNELQKMEDLSQETKQWRNRSIYKIPQSVKELNKNAYKPQIVSFGPYHHGEDHLKPMEEHKKRALVHFLKRCGKPIELFVNSIADDVQILKDSYYPLEAVWENNTERFIKLMILDGCFMLEILRNSTQVLLNDYDCLDPIFSHHGRVHMMPYILRDMLMLENQLQLLVLYKLVALETEHARVSNKFFFF